MNPNLSKKLVTALILVLLIANAATISMILFKKEERNPAAPDGPAKYIIKELKLNEQQQDAYFDLINEHQQAVRPLRQEIKKAKDVLFDLLQNSIPDEQAKAKAIKNIGELTAQLDLVTFDHFAKVRKLCTPTQQTKFDEIIKQVVQMMGMPHGGPPPGGPHHDGPPPAHPEEHPPF